MKNTAIDTFCDWGIVCSLCTVIFVLPVSIALIDSFAALAFFFYLLKKTNRIIIDWPSRTSKLYLLGKVHFIWKGFAPPVNFLNRPLQFLSLAVFISVLFSQYPGLSLLAFLGKFVKYLFLYFSFIEAFSDERRIGIFLKFFLLAAFITALSGVIQHYIGIDLLKGHLLSGGRVNASFFTANGLGAYLLPAIGLAAHLLYSAVRRKKSGVWTGTAAFLLVLLVACLCWTYSRSSWIGYLVILFVMALLDRRKMIYAGALLLIFIVIFLPSLENVRHMHLIDDGEYVQKEDRFLGESFLEQGGSGRLAFWKKAISISRSSPICGTGLNTYLRMVRQDPDKRTWWYAHNCYLQMTAETGLLGLVCFLWMLFVLFRHGFDRCFRGLDGHPWQLIVLQGIISGLLGFLAQSFFDNTFYTVQLGVLMWLIFGLMAAVIRLNPAPAGNL